MMVILDILVILVILVIWDIQVDILYLEVHHNKLFQLEVIFEESTDASFWNIISNNVITNRG
jgi:hypothetical protein